MVRTYSRAVFPSVTLAEETTKYQETHEIEELHMFHKEEV
jgi:hypothetical protein